MNIDRLCALAEDLIEAGDALIAAATPTVASTFLDRYARVLAYPEAARVTAGVEPVVAHARAFVATYQATLSQLAAEWLRLGWVDATARQVGTLDDIDIEDWAEIAVRTATLIPWLPTEAQGQAKTTTDLVIVEVAAFPHRFTRLVGWVSARAAEPAPGPWARGLLDALRLAPLWAVAEKMHRVGTTRVDSPGPT